MSMTDENKRKSLELMDRLQALFTEYRNLSSGRDPYSDMLLLDHLEQLSGTPVDEDPTLLLSPRAAFMAMLDRSAVRYNDSDDDEYTWIAFMDDVDEALEEADLIEREDV